MSQPTVWRERLTSPLTWHYAGFLVLLVTATLLAIRFGLDWRATNGSSTAAVAAQQMQLKAVDLQTAPLRGLDQRVDQSHKQLAAFFAKRIPPNYSSIATRIGELALRGPVRLTRVQYTKDKQDQPGVDLTPIKMDASITGSYPQIMRFVNSVERDQTFFVIRGLTLTGQQGGQVNLRLQVTTWLRPADAAASGLAQTPEPGDEDKNTKQPEKEGK